MCHTLTFVGFNNSFCLSPLKGDLSKLLGRNYSIPLSWSLPSGTQIMFTKDVVDSEEVLMLA